MLLPSPDILGAIFGLSELWLGIARRAKGQTQAADRHSWRLLVVVIALCVTVAVLRQDRVSITDLPLRKYYLIGLGLFVVGLLLRWWAIVYLGRFFTVNVAIATNHRLIQTGPYRWARHPSYTGLLLILIGLGVCFGDWQSLAILVIAPFLALIYRVRVEEAALTQAFGEEYADYRQRTKRFLPYLY